MGKSTFRDSFIFSRYTAGKAWFVKLCIIAHLSKTLASPPTKIAEK